MWRTTKVPLDESEKGARKSWLKTQHVTDFSPEFFIFTQFSALKTTTTEQVKKGNKEASKQFHMINTQLKIISAGKYLLRSGLFQGEQNAKD